MKKILINLLTFVVFVAVIVILFLSLGKQEGAKYVYRGNNTYQSVPIKVNEYQCSTCNMNIEILEYAAEVITKEGHTYFFDDIGCVILWLKDNKQEIEKVLTQTLDTHRWIEMKKAWYSRIAPSPMGYGFAAVEEKKDTLISYDEMRILMLQGKNLHDPFVKKRLLGE